MNTDSKTCSNCNSSRTAFALRGYYRCGVCGVWFIPDVNAESLYSYYHSGGYRTKHQQADEQTFQERRAAHIIQYIDAPRVFVDIGCSLGVLMDAVKNKWQAECYGVDIDTVLARNVYDHISRVPVRADCVTMIHSLEHMLHPFVELRQVYDCVEDGGQVIIEVPNTPGYPAAMRFPHVVMFDRESLKWTMEAAGFEVECAVIHGNGGVARAGAEYYLLMIGSKK